MPDEQTYGFNRDDAHSLLQSIETREMTFPELRPRGRKGGGSGRSTCTTVRFQILVADPLTRTALCVITARPYGCGVNDIPDTLVSGQAIEVCDPGGCFFNETNPPLVGREGWASYMMPVQGSTWCQQNPYYGMLPEWEVFSLCCATDACLL
jgi:hypothetical protein